jgi:selenocysteine lyase/cysteine desulfurase
VANSEVVHARLDLAARGIDSMVRASVHVTTTEDELDRTVELVDALSRGGA